MDIPYSFWHDFTTCFAFYIFFDTIWVGVIGRNFYHKLVQKIQKKPLEVKVWSSFLLYPLLALGQAIFVLPLARKNNKATDALWYSFIYGIIIYGSFDAINHSIFRNWSLFASLVDFTEGVLLSMTVGWLTYQVHHNISMKSR